MIGPIPFSLPSFLPSFLLLHSINPTLTIKTLCPQIIAIWRVSIQNVLNLSKNMKVAFTLGIKKIFLMEILMTSVQHFSKSIVLVSRYPSYLYLIQKITTVANFKG